MKIRSFFCMVALAIVFVLTASAADVTGKWVAKMPGRGGEETETVFQFKVAGETLTGSMENPMGATEISEGQVNGDVVSFAIVRDAGGNQMKMLYKGEVSGDQIKFTSSREGSDRTREFVASKVSQ